MDSSIEPEFTVKDRHHSGIAEDDPRHGTPAGYAAGCHQDCCRDAHTRDARHARHERLTGRGRRQPAIGSQRRIRALMALGWTSRDIADRTGHKDAEAVSNILARTWVQPDVRNRIKAAYDEMSMSLGPSEQGRNRARAKGWPVPLAWDDDTIDDPDAQHYGRSSADRDIDEVVVQRALSGSPVKANPAERQVIIARWTGTRNELARLLGANIWRDIREAS